jgi:hypothetical protein
MAKTSFRLKVGTSIWSVVEKWADENCFELETSDESNRLYLHHDVEADAKISADISQVVEDVHIEVWFSDLIRKELSIDSPSLYAALPRKEAFARIQKLLTKLSSSQPKKQKTAKRDSFAFNLGRSLRKLSGKNKKSKR